MSEPWLNDEDLGTIRAAVEHLRSCHPDESDTEGLARHADAAFRFAFRLEQIAKR